MTGLTHLPSLISSELGISCSEVRRLVYTGGVTVDGKRPLIVEDCDPRHLRGKRITVGKKRSFVVPDGGDAE